MDVVTISGNNHDSYCADAFATTYWEGMVGAAADAWVDPTNAVKRLKALVAATTVIDAETWDPLLAGTQALRYLLANPDGKFVFRMACADLAGLLLVDDSLLDKSTSGSNVERIDAGDGAGVRFFAPTLGETGRFPTRVQKYIGQYLGGSVGSVSGSYATGTKTYGPDNTPNTSFDIDGNGYGTTRSQ